MVTKSSLSWLSSDENVELSFMLEVFIVEVAEHQLVLQDHPLEKYREVLEIYVQQV